MDDARQPGGDSSDGADREAEQLGGFEAADTAAVGWGTAFGSGYLLQREIGVGGMGTVWRGWALDAQHAVAIKILHPHLSGDPGVVGRFLREGDVLKRLDHPNLVAVHDLVVEGGKLGLVMDLVEGGDVHARRKRHGTLPPAEAARIGAQAARGLAAAHALGVAHLDLKPANILISTRLEAAEPGDPAAEVAEIIDVRLTDFGIARLVDAADQVTTATTYGTPDYMAPEIALTGASGPASDLYALGITLYELVVGRTPHGGGQALAVLARHIERAPKRLPGIPDPLWEVIVACTAREPGDRPEAAAVAEYLAAAEPALVGLPALDPVPRSADFPVTSEPRVVAAESSTVAVPWLAAVAAANRLTQPVSQEPQPVADYAEGVGGVVSETGDTGVTGDVADTGEDAFAAALLKPPPSGPFSTLPQNPDPGPRVRLPAVSRTTRRRATLIGAPLVLVAAVGVSLIASGALASSPQTSNNGGRYTVGGPGSAQAGGGDGGAGNSSSASVGKSSSSTSKSKVGKSVSASATDPASSGSPAPGGVVPVGGSATTTTIMTTTSIATSAPPTSASPTATDTGWVCRVGGFKVDGALSEDPCIRDEDGTLMLEGELKGTYNSSVVVVVRVDYGGVYSSANISPPVTPSKLGSQPYVYKVIIGSWTQSGAITCQENIDPASDPQDYEYTANSGDIRPSS